MGHAPSPVMMRYVAQDAPTGYGEAAHRLVQALRRMGIRTELRGWRDQTTTADPPGLRPFSRDPLPLERASAGSPTVAHLVPEHLPYAVREVDGPLVAHTVWETDRIPAHWPQLLNEHAARVIVPTVWNRGVFHASGVTVPIAVVPHVVCDPVPGDGGVPLDIPADVVVFYLISRWDQRKDPAAVVRAFISAFTADDAVLLVVKTTLSPQYPVPNDWGTASTLSNTTALEIARLVRTQANPPLVQLEVEDWSPARLAGLHERGDCYVTLSHGEGWDIPAFDATAYGNPVITPGWGGPLTYLDADTACFVEHKVVSVEHFEPRSYSPDQHWADPNVEHASQLMREVAADLRAARRRAAPARARVLAEYDGERVVSGLAESVPELGIEVPRRPATSAIARIPRIAHFVWGLRTPAEPFHLVHALAIRSCLEVVKPDEIHLHCRHEPAGAHWDAVAPNVALHHVNPVEEVTQHDYTDELVRRYSYAHDADFVRLDVLAEHGGLYADLDTLFLAPIPHGWWHEEFVIGREAEVPDPAGGAPRPAISNAVMMSSPASAFVEAWRAEIGDALDGSWANHSSFLAHDLAARMPTNLLVAPQRAFHAFEPSPEGIALLLEHPAPNLDGIVALHLAAHLWWDEDRVDFSTVHAGTITEDWIRTSDATYAVAARRFLAA